MSSIASASCHGSRARATAAKTTASTSALRTMTTLRLYLSAHAPHSGTSGMPTTKIRALKIPTNARRSAVRDAHLAQVGRQQREDLADAEALDHRGDPEDRDEDPPVLGRAGRRLRVGGRGRGHRGSLADAPADGAAAASPDTRKRPKELMGTSVRRVLRLRTSPQSLVAAGSLARRPCDLRTWFPGPSRGSLPEPVWRFNLPLRARRNVRPGRTAHNGLIHELAVVIAGSYPRTCGRCGRSVDTLAREVPRWVDLLARLVAAQDALGATVRRLQPSLAERPVPPDPAGQGLPQRHAGWVTRSMPPSTDVPIGALLLTVILDVARPDRRGRHRPRRDHPVHAGAPPSPARPTTPTPTARPGPGRRSTRR